MASQMDGVMQIASFADEHCVEKAVARDRHSVLRASRNSQEQDGLDSYVRGGHVERLEHAMRRALSVRLGVQRSFRERNWMFFGRVFFMSVQFVTIPCSMGYFNSKLVAAVAAQHP